MSEKVIKKKRKDRHTYCKHNKAKRYCDDPTCDGGAALCKKHRKRKSRCNDPECGIGSEMCKKHGIRRIRCKDPECKGGSELCKASWCNIQVASNQNKYQGYCFRCFIYTFPDEITSTNYKTKELEIKKIVYQYFQTLKYDWKADRIIEGGCSRKRPDLCLDLGFAILIIEVDENKHSGAGYSCDYKRMELLSEDIGFLRPIIFIRFNPDSYINKDNEKITSCWKINKKGAMVIINKKEWEERCDKLKTQIEYWIKEENKPKNLLQIEYLYYDEVD